MAPENPLHRQYEALRAFFVGQRASVAVARSFAYSPGAFRVLCHQFRHDLAKRAAFFQHPKHGPQHAPVRDRVRVRAVALRKRNLSVYEYPTGAGRRQAAHQHQRPLRAVARRGIRPPAPAA